MYEEYESYMNRDDSMLSGETCRTIIRRINWTTEEDNFLLQLTKTHGQHDWDTIEDLFNKQFRDSMRNQKQIKDRFFNYIDPSINKSAFSQEEKQKLRSLHLVYKNKWTKIAQEMPGRTSICVRKFFYTEFRLKLRDLIKEYEDSRESVRLDYKKVFKLIKKTKSDIEKENIFSLLDEHLNEVRSIKKNLNEVERQAPIMYLAGTSSITNKINSMLLVKIQQNNSILKPTKVITFTLDGEKF